MAFWHVSQGFSHSTLLCLRKAKSHSNSDPTLRFVWAETIWMQMWWQNQTPDNRAAMKRLVDNKQLEFVGGGWVMNDEVIHSFLFLLLHLKMLLIHSFIVQIVAIYDDVIDQVTAGHTWLTENFGDGGKVKHGWQIDMFTGYSVSPTKLLHQRLTEVLQGVTPSLWALMGYDATVVLEPSYIFNWKTDSLC